MSCFPCVPYDFYLREPSLQKNLKMIIDITITMDTIPPTALLLKRLKQL